MLGKAETENLIKDYFNFLSTKQLGIRSKALYVTIIKQFIKWLGDREINSQTLNEFLVSKQKLYVRSALNYLIEMKGLNVKLAKIREKRREKITPPRREELKNLLEKIKQEDEELYWFFSILYYTGERHLAVLNMKLGDIDFNKNQIKFRGKGDKVRVVNLPGWFVKEFRDWVREKKGVLENEKFFFVTEMDYLKKRDNPKEEIISEELSKWRLWKRIEELKGLTQEEKRILHRTHNFRRAMINWILETGDILEAKAFIGHEDISTTQRYVSELLEEKKKRIVEEKIMKEMEGG